jgi:hemoglobin
MRQRSTILELVAFGVLAAGAMGACARKEAGTGDTTVAAPDTAAKAAAPRSLYDRLGGQPAVTAVVDSFVAIVAKDDRINKKFAKSDVARVKSKLVEQVCAQTGGPCTYTGLPMKQAHTNMGVTEGEFNALVEDLVKTLTAFNVPKAEQDELLGALGTMKGDIVEVPGSTATGTPLPKNFTPAAKAAAK